MHWHCGQGRVLLGKLLLVSTSINPFFQPSFSYLQTEVSTWFDRISQILLTFNVLDETRRTSLAMWRRRPASPFAESIPRVGASQQVWDLQEFTWFIYMFVNMLIRASILANIVFDICYMLLYAYINLLVEEERTTWPCIYKKWCRTPTCLMSTTVP